jgi:hypothetical protein
MIKKGVVICTRKKRLIFAEQPVIVLVFALTTQTTDNLASRYATVPGLQKKGRLKPPIVVQPKAIQDMMLAQ